jgi:predicted methyltransferase
MKSAHHFSIAAVSLSLLSWLPTAAIAVAVPGQGTWETTLFARDINADGTVDAYFDATRNVTWLADANAKAINGTSFDDGFRSNDGKVTYASARSWLAGLDVYSVTGWRVPVADLVPMYGT